MISVGGRTIRSFTLPNESRCLIDMPKGARIIGLSGATQVKIGFYAVCDPNVTTEKRLFVVVEPNQRIPAGVVGVYLGMVRHPSGSTVWHVFDCGVRV